MSVLPEAASLNLKLFEPLPKQVLGLTCLQYKYFENTVGKGEIFPTHFKKFHPSSPSNMKLQSANTFSLEGSKICLGKGKSFF